MLNIISNHIGQIVDASIFIILFFRLTFVEKIGSEPYLLNMGLMGVVGEYLLYCYLLLREFILS